MNHELHMVTLKVTPCTNIKATTPMRWSTISYVTLDDNCAMVDNNYAMIDDYLCDNSDAMMDNNHTTIMMRQSRDR